MRAVRCPTTYPRPGGRASGGGGCWQRVRLARDRRPFAPVEATLWPDVRSAWFLSHRIGEARRDDGTADFGSGGGVVEVDETFIGRDRNKPIRRGYAHKHKVPAPVDRTTGKSRTMVVDDRKATTLTPTLRENIAAEATVCTDEAGRHLRPGRVFADHDFVRNGAGQRAKPGGVHTNTARARFSIFKRGLKCVRQHCSKRHLHRYAAEFEFRYNDREANGPNDAARTAIAPPGVRGKRLMYEESRP